MKRFKKILYWTTIVPIWIVTTPLIILGGISDWIEELCHMYEGWSFDYKKNGWVYMGEGFWEKESKK